MAFLAAVGDLWLIKHSPANIEATTAEEGGWLERDGRNFSSWFRGVLTEKLDAGPSGEPSVTMRTSVRSSSVRVGRRCRGP